MGTDDPYTLPPMFSGSAYAACPGTQAQGDPTMQSLNPTPGPSGAARTATAYVARSTKPLYLILLDDGVTFEEADSHPPEFVAFPAADCPHAAAVALEAVLPRHDVSFSLEHNPHRVYYETVEQHEADRGDARDWSDPEDFQRAIDTDELWVAHWYPDTPVGSYRVCASTLARLLERISEDAE